MPGISDAIAREAEWLTLSGDGLPALLEENGGPFKVVQARWPRTPQTQVTALYLMPATASDARWANARKLGTYNFRAFVRWPIGINTISIDLAEQAQVELDNALELLIDRIRGNLHDHSHGGRFLAVAEAPAHTAIDVHYTPPETTVSDGYLRADVLYQAQDQFII